MRRRIDPAFALCLALISVAPATAKSPDTSFAVAPGPLDAALATFAVQSGIDVGVVGGGISGVRSRGVTGSMPPARALDRLLAGTPWRAEAIAGGGFRLVRRERSVAPPPPPPRRVRPAPPARPGEILVNANKYTTSRLRFPGTISLIDRRNPGFLVSGDQGLTDLTSQAPTLQSTALGSGRDKVFIRGVADSSFLGPSQATTGVYYGDVQLAYTGPDPNLRLYDVDHVEVLQGPQGTLYGAGTIGGVIRIAPNAPDPSRVAATVTAGVTATQGAAFGTDLSGMINLPLLAGKAALRAVGYRSVDGGYLDDLLRQRRDINRTLTTGGRATARLLPADGWTVDLGGILQSISTRDSQYALRRLPRLSRVSVMAQPFEDDFALALATVTKKWDSGLTLQSASGFIHTAVDDRFDATLVPQQPLAYDTHNRNRQFTQEVRLNRSLGGGGGWVLGGSYLYDRMEIGREYGAPDQQRALQGVTNRTRSLALFGQGTLALGRRLAVTAGARLTRAQIDSSPSVDTRGSTFVRGQRELRVDPTASFSFLLNRRLAWFGRYAKGFRTGGLAVAPGVGRVANFIPDSLELLETGLRLEPESARGVSGTIAFSHAHWSDIQADLINARGFPFTSNVGNGRIDGLEASLDWSPHAGLHLDAGAFLASALSFDRPDLPPGVRATNLPDTPRFSGVGSARYQFAVGRDTAWVGLSGRYVGNSYLDPAALLAIRQGGYLTVDASAGWQRGKVRVDLLLDNVANVLGNRFALGNPFSVMNRDQYTPVRPRNLRMAVSVGF